MGPGDWDALINQSISGFPSVPGWAQWGVRSNMNASRQQHNTRQKQAKNDQIPLSLSEPQTIPAVPELDEVVKVRLEGLVGGGTAAALSHMCPCR